MNALKVEIWAIIGNFIQSGGFYNKIRSLLMNVGFVAVC